MEEITPLNEGRGLRNISKPEGLGRGGNSGNEQAWRYLKKMSFRKQKLVSCQNMSLKLFIPSLAQTEKVLSSKDGRKRLICCKWCPDRERLKAEKTFKLNTHFKAGGYYRILSITRSRRVKVEYNKAFNDTGWAESASTTNRDGGTSVSLCRTQ